MDVTLCCLTKVFRKENIDKFAKYSTLFKEIIIISNEEGKDLDIKKIRVFHAKFENNFSNLRNYALSKCKTEWIFFLDSDEELSEELIHNLPNLLSESNEIDGIWLSRKTFITKDKYLKHGLFYPDYQLRLFRNKKEYRYEGAIHEMINVPLKKTKHVNLDILHYQRNPKYTEFSDLKNFDAYIEIESEELKKKDINPYRLIFSGYWKGITTFLSGYFRGKGFLDGWAGFRAHVNFSIYLAKVSIIAGEKKLK